MALAVALVAEAWAAARPSAVVRQRALLVASAPAAVAPESAVVHRAAAALVRAVHRPEVRPPLSERAAVGAGDLQAGNRQAGRLEDASRPRRGAPAAGKAVPARRPDVRAALGRAALGKAVRAARVPVNRVAAPSRVGVPVDVRVDAVAQARRAGPAVRILPRAQYPKRGYSQGDRAFSFTRKFGPRAFALD